MRKQRNEAIYYKIFGILELILSIVLTSVFIFMMVTSGESSYTATSVIFIFTFAFLTFSTSLWFLYHKTSDVENNLDAESNNIKIISEKDLEK